MSTNQVNKIIDQNIQLTHNNLRHKIPQENLELEQQLMDTYKDKSKNFYLQNQFQQKHLIRNLADEPALPYDKDNINIYLPCTQDTEDFILQYNIVEQSKIETDRTKFIIDLDIACPTYLTHPNVASQQIVINIFVRSNVNEICDLKEIDVNLGCNGFSLKIQTIELNGENTTTAPQYIDDIDGYSLLIQQGIIQNPSNIVQKATLDTFTNIKFFQTGSIVFFSIIIQNSENFINISTIQQFQLINCKLQNIKNYEDAAIQSKAVGAIIFINSQFIGNQNLYDNGGVLEAIQTQIIKIIDCLFEDNQTIQYSGAIYILTVADCLVQDTVFTNNISQLLNAGTITVLEYQLFTIQSSTFKGSKATQDCGAVLVYGGLQLVIKDSVFEENQAGVRGGAIALTYLQGKAIIQDTKFIKNKALGDEGGGLVIFLSNEIEFINVDFEDNISGFAAGSIAFKQSSILKIDNCRFKRENASSGYGGSIRVSNADLQYPFTLLQFKNSDFEDNQAKFGGAIQLYNISLCKDCLFENLTFRRNKAHSAGGSIVLDTVSQSTLFKNIKIYNSEAKDLAGSIGLYNVKGNILNDILMQFSKTNGKGGGIYMQDDCEDIQLLNIIYQDSEAGEQGGIYIKSSKLIVLTHIEMHDNTAGKDAAGIMVSDSDNITINHLHIEKNQAYKSVAFVFDLSSNITINDGEINDNTAQDSIGAGEFLTCTDITINNLNIINNSAGMSFGGIMFSQSQRTIYNDSKILNNKCENIGGGVIIENCDVISLYNLQINENISNRNGGGVVITSSRSVTFQKINLQKNKSLKQNGGALFIDNSTIINFNDIQIYQNIALEGSGMQLQIVNNFVFQNIQIYKNECEVQAAGINISECQDGEFLNFQIYKNNSSLKGAGIVIDQGNNIQFYNGNINTNLAKLGPGGGFIIQNKSTQIIIEKTEIYKNMALELGGAIYFYNSNSITLKNSILHDNIAILFGAAIYSRFCQQLYIVDSLIFNHGLHYYELLTQKGVDFFDGEFFLEDTHSEKGSALYSDQLKYINIQGSQFKNNQGYHQGGAISIYNTTQLIIQDTKFEKCKIGAHDIITTQLNGGSIIATLIDTLIFNKIEIRDSYTPQKGGAVFINGANDILIKDSIFYNNTVDIDPSIPLYQKDQYYQLTLGGALYIEPKMVQTLSNNVNNVKETIQKLTLLNNNFQLNSASSGGAVYISQNPHSSITFDINNNIFKSNLADLGPSIRFIGQFQTKSIEDLKSYNSNQDINGTSLVLPETNYYFGYYKNERKIVENYALFTLCFQGSFLEEGGKLLCDQCIENAECEGGYIPIYPSQGYWRTDNTSYKMIHCENNPTFCTGNDTCLLGYTGLLCEQCDYTLNYASIGAGECGECAENKWVIYQRLLLIFLGLVLLLLNQIYGVNMRIKKRQIQRILNVIFDYSVSRISQLSGLTKIFIMHCQITYLVASFNIEIPIEVTQSFNILGNPQEMFSNSINCLIEVNNQDEIKRLGYSLSMYSLIATILAVLFIMLLEFSIFCCKRVIKKRSQLIQYMQCSVLCFFITLQPGLLQQYLSFITCRKIANGSYSIADTNIDCSEDFFKHQILPINIIMVVTLGFLIPIFLGYRLYKGKQSMRLKRIEFQRKFGILFMEYRNDHFYWEIYSILTKITIVVLSIVFDQDIVLKGMYVLFVLIIYGYMCLMKWPFVTRQLNQLSLTSTIVQIITIGLVICLQVIEENEKLVLKLMIILIILSTNIIFIFVSGVLMVMDFKMSFRNVFTSNLNIGCSNIRVWINKKITNERMAKIRWRKIKLSIHEIVLKQRTGNVTNFQQELLDHMKKIFYIKHDFVSAKTPINRYTSRVLSMNSTPSYNQKIQKKINKYSKTNTINSQNSNQVGNQKQEKVKQIYQINYDIPQDIDDVQINNHKLQQQFQIIKEQNESGITNMQSFNNSVNVTSRQQLVNNQSVQQGVQELNSILKDTSMKQIFQQEIHNDSQNNIIYNSYRKSQNEPRKYSQEPTNRSGISLPSIVPKQKTQRYNSSFTDIQKQLQQQQKRNSQPSSARLSRKGNSPQQNYNVSLQHIPRLPSLENDILNSKVKGKYSDDITSNGNNQHAGDSNSEINFTEPGQVQKIQSDNKLNKVSKNQMKKIQFTLQSSSDMDQQSIQTGIKNLEQITPNSAKRKTDKNIFRKSSKFRKNNV